MRKTRPRNALFFIFLFFIHSSSRSVTGCTLHSSARRVLTWRPRRNRRLALIQGFAPSVAAARAEHKAKPANQQPRPREPSVSVGCRCRCLLFAAPFRRPPWRLWFVVAVLSRGICRLLAPRRTGPLPALTSFDLPLRPGWALYSAIFPPNPARQQPR